MKILLSAFACEPDRGSEYAVGWNWALSLVRAGHEVVVLTCSEARPAIERTLERMQLGTQLRCAYFDVPKPFRWQARGPLHLHAALWQWLAVKFARELHAREKFDRVHHVTYAGLRIPSFMGRLGIPFVFGPVGGGERAPWRLRWGYSVYGLMHDAARDAANMLIRFTPFMTETFARAERIYVTSAETLRLLPQRFRDKARVELAIGAEDMEAAIGRAVPRPPRQDCFRVLYAGRFVDYKGMHLGLPAFARLVQAVPSARLTMAGDGPMKRRWQRMAENLGIAGSIDWLPWQDHHGMARLYAGHDVLLFSAMHDTGGMVILEAMHHGLPVVCLKLGGPAALVDASCGYAVDTTDKSAAQVIAEMGDALISLARETTRQSLAQGARQRCQAFSWREKVIRVHGLA
ncbi:MAG TPA: glycosyltransferase [Ferrovibrio sp.]|uniref:glycosyltransferase family 4 protein n=1 Tax=Ferrovibrio sp. TaxID=1917215 RepID=UPI002B4AB586|nr:glycosyltransferase [Ferrovibrio sp.]HLT76230.1 glycosyltransferase [Ferrovibrio sp.]